ncbi:MAG TPA: hypothetical protein VNI61_05595 [Gemmatimonadales bacterium]|nr:hypothetical protein [Gemmatimonadales bacterium]
MILAPSMGQPRWARSTDSVADVLRRGAWYRVLEDDGEDQVVLEVRGRPMRFTRDDLTIRATPPDRWSVVVRTGVLRPTLGGGEGQEVVTTYAVCPHCAERQDLPPAPAKPPRLTCGRCGREALVDWAPC